MIASPRLDEVAQQPCVSAPAPGSAMQSCACVFVSGWSRAKQDLAAESALAPSAPAGFAG